MIKHFSFLRKSKTFQDLNVVFLENILVRLLSFILFLILARTLGPDKYGIYSVISVSILFLVPFFDFGMENIAVRFSGVYENKKESLFGLYLITKTSFAGILIFMTLLFPGVIPTILNKPETQNYLFIILIGFVLGNYQGIIAAYFVSTEKFSKRAFVNVGTFLIRLISILLLIKYSVNDIKFIALLFALSSIPFIILFIKHLLKFLRAYMQFGIDKVLLAEIFNYGKWIVLMAIPHQLMTRLDFYMVSYFSSFKEMGLYNSAVSLISIFSFIPFIVATVYLPKISKYKEHAQVKQFIRRVVKVGIPITIIIIALMPFSKHFILLLLGEKYFQSFSVFQFLLCAFIFNLWNIMLGTVFYGLGKSKYMAVGAYVHLTLFCIIALNTAPHIGIKGILWSKVIANATYLGIVVLYLNKLMRASNRENLYS